MIKSLEFLTVGSCTFPDFIFRKGGKFKRRRFPAQVALIEDDQLGWLLFDTGYAPAFFQASQKWPEQLYALTTPVTLTEDQELLAQLASRNLSPNDISHLLLSHFHADHIAGLRSFPKAQFHYHAPSLDLLTKLSRFQQVRQGFLAQLIPPDFSARSHLLTPSSLNTPTPIFPDSAYSWIALPGHAPGHCGLLISTPERKILLAADAFWTHHELEGQTKITRIARAILHDPRAYQKTQTAIRHWLDKSTTHQAYPSHDSSRVPTKITFS